MWGKNSQVSADILLWPARLSETSLPSCPLGVCVYNTSITSAMTLTDFSKQLKPNLWRTLTTFFVRDTFYYSFPSTSAMTCARFLYKKWQQLPNCKEIWPNQIILNLLTMNIEDGTLETSDLRSLPIAVKKCDWGFGPFPMYSSVSDDQRLWWS